MHRKILPKSALKEALFIIIIASVLGLCVNAFNPKGVSITTTRPFLVSAPDSLFANDLPVIGISDGKEKDLQDQADIGESLIVNTDKVRRLLANDQAVLLDARSKGEYQNGYIPQSINLPFESLAEHQHTLNSLPKDKWLVCFCDGPPCDLGELLAFELMAAGYTHVVIYNEGLHGWEKSGGNINVLGKDNE